MDLASAANIPGTIDVGGKEYPIRMLVMREWAAFQAWLKKASPSPLTRAAETIKQERDAGTPLDAVTTDQLLDHAQRASLTWPPKVDSREWYAAIDSADGGLAHLIHTVLVAADPAFKPDAAKAIAERLTESEWRNLQSFAFIGEPAPPQKKAEGATSPPTETPSETTGD